MNGKASHTDSWVSRDLHERVRAQLDERNKEILGLRKYIENLERQTQDLQDRYAAALSATCSRLEAATAGNHEWLSDFDRRRNGRAALEIPAGV